MSGLNCFQRLSADDTCQVDCGHKLDTEKITFFSRSDPTAHECSLAMTITNKSEHTIGQKVIIFSSLSLANSEDPDEMPYNAVFHQGLRCLLS